MRLCALAAAALALAVAPSASFDGGVGVSRLPILVLGRRGQSAEPSAAASARHGRSHSLAKASSENSNILKIHFVPNHYANTNSW
jgi:hypothetical protein